MIRKIVEINEEKCTGCGLCAKACHEGAIAMVSGKAKLIRDDYCDGLGDCLPACPADAIRIVEREAVAYDEAAVLAAQAAKEAAASAPLPCGCPGSAARQIKRPAESAPCHTTAPEGQLMQWPVQIQLLPVRAPYYDGADLLIAADCTAFAYGDFHNRFIRSRITLVGCPKLDSVDYAEKLTAILAENNIRSVTVTRMQVPCCGGLENAVRRAMAASGKALPLEVATITAEGRILS